MRKIFLTLLACFVCISLYAANKVKIQYYGLSCFVLTTPSKLNIVIDPFDKKYKYPLPEQYADVVLISNENAENNNYKDVRGFPIIQHGLSSDGKAWNNIDFHLRDTHITNLISYQDSQKGSLRGLNSIFIIDIDHFKIVHLGNLGTKLSKKDISGLGNVDVLMIPVGGFCTLDAPDASMIVTEIKPKIVIPMHYKTADSTNTLLEPVDKFLKFFKNVYKLRKNYLKINIDKPIKKTGVYVLSCK